MSNEHREQAREIVLRILRLRSSTELAGVYAEIVNAFASALSAGDPNNLCEQHKAAYKVFHVGGCLKCWLDSELASRDAEVRKVLEGLGSKPSGCWCALSHLTETTQFEEDGTHDDACLAAHALYAKLQPGEESLTGR